MSDDAPALETVSQSFGDLKDVYQNLITDQIFSAATERLIGPINKQIIGDAKLPGDVKKQSDKSISISLLTLAQCYTPDLLENVQYFKKKFDKIVKSESDIIFGNALNNIISGKFFTSIPYIGSEAHKLVTVAKVMGVDPTTSTARLLYPDISYETAKDRYSFSGTLIKANMKGGKDFAIYFPNSRCSFGKTPDLTVSARSIREVSKEANVRYR